MSVLFSKFAAPVLLGFGVGAGGLQVGFPRPEKLSPRKITCFSIHCTLRIDKKLVNKKKIDPCWDFSGSSCCLGSHSVMPKLLKGLS